MFGSSSESDQLLSACQPAADWNLLTVSSIRLLSPVHVLSSAGLHHVRQTGSEGRTHRPEWNSTHRGHGGARGAGRPQQVDPAHASFRSITHSVLM